MHRSLPWFLLLCLAILGCDDAISLSLPPEKEPATSEQGDATAPLQVYFTNPKALSTAPGNPAQALAGHIAKAKQTIDVCAFELDNQVIVDALLAALKRGVKLRLVTETDYLDEHGVQALKAAGVPIIDDQRDGALMHNKFMVFDGRAVWTGSMNFTENCAYRNNNHGLFIDDPLVAANYATKFRWMFEDRKFGGLPAKTARIPNPNVTLRDGTPVENYFSTHDRVADKVLAHIQKSQRDLHFLAFSFTHDAMGDAMLARGGAGVEVLGVFEKSQAASTYSEYHRLRGAGSRVQVYLDANPRNMHHKVMIIDGQVTVAGSFNFSDGADKQNDENVVIIHSRSIAQQFEAEFRKLHADAKDADLTGTTVAK